jgi:hypothetical protein
MISIRQLEPAKGLCQKGDDKILPGVEPSHRSTQIYDCIPDSPRNPYSLTTCFSITVMSTDVLEDEVPEADLETNAKMKTETRSSEDVPMENETEKMQRAARQSAFLIFSI